MRLNARVGRTIGEPTDVKSEGYGVQITGDGIVEVRAAGDIGQEKGPSMVLTLDDEEELSQLIDDLITARVRLYR